MDSSTGNKSTGNRSTGGRIAFIEAMWHYEIVQQVGLSFVAEAGRLGISEDRIDFFQVPGSLEIPLQAKLLAKSGNYDIIIASGLIVNGGIYRHDFVAETVIDAMMGVQLETEIPILSVVLTPHSFHEHADHKNFFHEHFKVKGVEAAEACAKTLENLEMLAKAA